MAKISKIVEEGGLDVYGVPCPYCFAGRKVSCETEEGKKTGFHMARQRKALEKGILRAAKLKRQAEKETPKVIEYPSNEDWATARKAADDVYKPAPTTDVDYRITGDSVLAFVIELAMLLAALVLMGAVLYLVFK